MTLVIHNLRPAVGSKHSKKRVGRGNASGHGTYSTRGGKGQTARSGGSRGLKFKGFKAQMQATPKLAGFRSLNTKPDEIYLSDLEEKFNDGDKVTLETVREKKLIKTRVAAVKILGTGKLTKKLVVENIKCTKSATEAIKKAGGEVK
ncbi:MAG: 50S ribosomal protein L15 [Candidatus Magasanikbacteria bacterium RIFOXYD2_FULL_41_14]|uniref:Large ribosomal subunit protein uL15 n=1 Tax=Candidatus Magasanikbacteria bacterium RIFOXYD2_FULL_41_14 TaxID=1798709 RepID=A0A1F6PBY9_9BACT|nr:MAG: 50S ribosomal protein L15 [Candidatus Magasanikbacteria bacterium RIFOXYD2_FULL_41_14]